MTARVCERAGCEVEVSGRSTRCPEHQAEHRLLAVELKREGGRPTAAQHAWLAALGGCPGVEVDVWRPAQWHDGAIERALRATTDGGS